MGAQFIHSILVPDRLQAADGEFTIDLPVNPLSMIYLNVKPLNDTGTIAEYGLMQRLLSAINNIRIDWRGTALVDITGQDLAAFLWMAHKSRIAMSNASETDDERRAMVIPIPLTRDPWSLTECFPQTKRGELILTIDWDIADTGFNGLRFSIETLELPSAAPTHFQRMTTQAITFQATGNNDVDMPIGQIIRQILCFGTTGFTGAAPAPTIGALRLLVDNIENGYSSGDYETLRAIPFALGQEPHFHTDHMHGVNAGGAGQEDTQSQQVEAALYDNYVLLEYDADRKDTFALDTKLANRVHLRINAEATNAARFIPIEKVLVTDFVRN